MTITNGTVKYGRTVKTGDYENKRADVELSFTVEADQEFEKEAMAAALEAHRLAHRLLGLNQADKAEAPAKRGPGRPPKPPQTTSAPLTVEATTTAATTTTEPSAEGIPEFLDRNASDAGEIMFDESKVPEPDISDIEMSAAMNRKVNELKVKHQGAAPGIIKALISKFVEPSKRSHDIPQPLRRKFLTDLAALV